MGRSVGNNGEWLMDAIGEVKLRRTAAGRRPHDDFVAQGLSGAAPIHRTRDAFEILLTPEQWDAMAAADTAAGLRRFTYRGMLQVAERLDQLAPEGGFRTIGDIAYALHRWSREFR
jgi:hypothetical protein